MTRLALFWSLLVSAAAVSAQEIPPELLRKAAQVTPTAQQWAWQRMEWICFTHFGVNTFTDREWGDGKEDPSVFQPTAFDARQWVQACKDAGMKMIILTAKHHDGFCLWPSQYTTHSVRSSPWRNGRGDVVREVADACREGGIRFGFYLSPWDRHEATYGTDAYNEYYKKQLRELCTNYGPVTEVWWDGACGEGPNGKRQVYDWPGYIEVVRQLQPNAVIAIMGPDVRWVGNESGLARENEWSVLTEEQRMVRKVADLGDRKYLTPDAKLSWYPAECDVSIRRGWFYHQSQDDQVKPLLKLLDIYYRSVGRNAVLLLNVPPDRRGLFHENDVARLKEVRAVLDETLRTDLAAGRPATASTSAGEHGPERIVDGQETTWWSPSADDAHPWLQIDLPAAMTFDRAMLQEAIERGQRVERFSLEAWDGQAWRSVVEAGTIGYKRLLRFAPVTAQRVRLNILQSRDVPAIAGLGLFRASAQDQEPPPEPAKTKPAKKSK